MQKINVEFHVWDLDYNGKSKLLCKSLEKVSLSVSVTILRCCLCEEVSWFSFFLAHNVCLLHYNVLCLSFPFRPPSALETWCFHLKYCWICNVLFRFNSDVMVPYHTPQSCIVITQPEHLDFCAVWPTVHYFLTI